MTEEEIRLSLPGDEEQLKSLWREVFGDRDERVDLYFDKLYAPGSAGVCTDSGRAVSCAWGLRLGELVSDGRWTPCRLVRAATLPEYRGRGLAGAAVSLLLDAPGPGITAAPGEPDMLDWLGRLGFRPAFSAVTQECTDVGLKLHGSVSRVTLRGYAALREELLYGVPHVDLDMKLLEYRESLCTDSGGGLYYVVSDGVRCCATAEFRDGRARIGELIVPTGSRYNAAALVARALRAQEFSYSSPARRGEESTPTALLTGRDAPESLKNAWLGVTLD